MTDASNNNSLGKQLREARVAAKLSLREMARRLDLAASYVNDIEHDRRVPSEEVLLKLADELELDADHLLGTAGRMGEGAERYLKSNPTAGVLFRRISKEDLSEEELKQMLRQMEKVVDKRKKPGDQS